jgi:hypothetical protein
MPKSKAPTPAMITRSKSSSRRGSSINVAVPPAFEMMFTTEAKFPHWIAGMATCTGHLKLSATSANHHG